MVENGQGGRRPRPPRQPQRARRGLRAARVDPVTSDFKGTAAVVRRALERSFTGVDPGDAVWKGRVGPRGETVLVDVEPFDEERAAVRIESHVGGRAGADARGRPRRAAGERRARARPLPVPRRRRRDRADGARRADAARAGGAHLGLGGRLGGGRVPHPDRGAAARASPSATRCPCPRVEPRRGAQERVDSARERVERFLRERYGEFEDDPHWGYHGPFGSARVFCTVGHYLETSTAITVALAGADRRGARATGSRSTCTRSRCARRWAASRCPRSTASCGSSTRCWATTSTRTSCTARSRSWRSPPTARTTGSSRRYGGRRYADLVSGEGA